MWGPRRQKSTVAFPLFPGSVLVVLKLFNGSLSLAHFKIQTFKITKKTFHSSTFFMLHHYILKQHNPIVLCHVFPYYAIAISLIFNFIHSFTPKLNSHCSWTESFIHSFHLFILSSYQLQGFFLFCATRWRKKTHQRTGPKLQNFQTKTKPQSLKTPKEPTSTTTTKQGCGVLTLWKASPLTKKPSHLPAKN